MKRILLGFSLLTTVISSAQWTEVNNDLPSTTATGLANVRDTLFVAIKSHGIFFTVNNGDNWTEWKNNSKLTSKEITNFHGLEIFPTAAGGNNFIATGPSMVNTYTSISGGGDLTASVFKSYSVPEESINVYLEDGQDDIEYHFIGTNNGVYYSTDEQTWTASNGLSGDALMVNDIYVQEYDDESRAVFALTKGGIYKSVDWGKNFTAFTNGISSNTEAYDQTILVGTSQGLYFFSKDSDTYSPFIPSGEYRTSVIDYGKLTAYAFGNNVGSKITMSTGQSEPLSLENVTGGTINSCMYVKDYLFICTDNGGVFRMPIGDNLGVGDFNEVPAIEFSVAPNPSNGNFVITVGEPITVELYGANGIFIASYELNNTLEINENLAPGLYFLKQKGSSNTKKVIIK